MSTAVAALAQRVVASPTAGLTVAVAERRPRTASFSAPVVLGASSGPPGLAVAGDGRAVAAWIGPEGAVWAALRDRAGAWQPAERLSGAAPARGVSVAVGSAAGEVVGRPEDAPMVATRGWRGGWSAPGRVAPPGPMPPRSGAVVATDLLAETVAVPWRQGPAPLSLRAALVAWSQADGRGSARGARPRGGPLGPVEAVSTGPGSRVEPAMAIETGGAVTAAWVALPPPGGAGPRARPVAATRRVSLVSG